MNKIEARKKALDIRKELDSNTISNKIVEEIIKSNILDSYNHIGIYYPIGNEINIIGLLDYYKDKNFYLPITRDEIHFIKYQTNDKLVKAKFNTYEPIGEIVNRSNIECFIIPCVAISADNKRLGYGKGYYDRYLSNYKGITIGVAYDFQEVDKIDVKKTDVKLNYIIKGELK